MEIQEDSSSDISANRNKKYTCLACGIAFREAELQRAHYKSDWHRYNLKRKVANMPAVTAADFQVRVLAARDRAQNEVNQQNHGYACNSCKKYFNNQSTLENHLKSKKHRDYVLKSKSKRTDETKTENHQEKSSVEEERQEESHDEEEIEEYQLTINDCLFCSHESVNLQSNLRHMMRSHSFFIPNIQYLTNIEGFMEYLCQKISIGCECLYCNDKGKAFQTLEAVKNHMLDKGHCKFSDDEESMLEYSDFYDFSSSYPDHVEGDEDEDVAAVAKDIQLSDDGMTLILPNGNRIGHRSLRVFYKQQFSNLPAMTPAEKRAIKSNLMSQYQVIGWNTTAALSKSFIKRHNKVREISQKIKSKDATRLAVKANKFQFHFRCQIDF
ncbi:uncharacterized protein TRIADDRAFT_18203 [Trichoplax adhaerens]|uniref:C2H2-type domain-containing protein n=1 Tax=Trichoplax adhaerens TaxID=10228 RepID=B3RL33_TRIAD|nr:hypothetical protein TRIADDRAFT_18203 [Trichoplax adhaerens]EDV29480.1 hypothetical protein TRIADDRAFT_18203 [Trichoplax adhaerens]|eukprot:XP_002108682.1 hypothetical protein TRIADDRAFT_18203 [Trichoplax adhaerens]